MPARFFLRGWKARREAKSPIAEGHFVACPTCCVSNGSQGRLGSAGSCANPDRRHDLNRGWWLCGCGRGDAKRPAPTPAVRQAGDVGISQEFFLYQSRYRFQIRFARSAFSPSLSLSRHVLCAMRRCWRLLSLCQRLPRFAPDSDPPASSDYYVPP